MSYILAALIVGAFILSSLVSMFLLAQSRASVVRSRGRTGRGDIRLAGYGEARKLRVGSPGD